MEINGNKWKYMKWFGWQNSRCPVCVAVNINKEKYAFA